MEYSDKAKIMKTLTELVSQWLVVFFIIFMIVGAIIGCWQIKRHFNYTVSYKSMVEETVRQMVKAEALK
jgi:DNA-binding transcriptional regulator of glucitol operon